MRVYYIAFRSDEYVSWRIVQTNYDLQKARDLIRFIAEQEAEEGTPMVLIYWQELELEQAGRIQ